MIRFCDFFIDYKIRIRGIKDKYKFVELPNYKKYGISLFIPFFIIGLILQYIIKNNYYKIFEILSIIILLGTLFFSFSRKNLRSELENVYKTYSKQRMNEVLLLLKENGIHQNDSEKIERLIEQCIMEKERCRIFKSFEYYTNALFKYILLPLITLVFSKIAEINSEVDKWIILLINIFLILLIIASLLLLILPPIQKVFDRDSNYYDDLKYDLEQVLIFGGEIAINESHIEGYEEENIIFKLVKKIKFK